MYVCVCVCFGNILVVLYLSVFEGCRAFIGQQLSKGKKKKVGDL